MPIEDQNPQGSDESTVIMGESSGKAASAPGPSASPEEPVRPSSPTPPPSDETVIGKSASAMEVPEQKAAPKLSDTQDTVVSPRLRQLAQTPGQPLRPPPAGGGAQKSSSVKLPVIGSAPPRLYILVGVVAVLVLMMVVLIGVLVARNGPTLLSGLTSTRTPTPTATRPATATLSATATRPPTTPTQPPTPAPPTPKPRPAPTALAKEVLAKVTPPQDVKLKVREQASTAGKVLGELERDVEVAIVDGPTEANGITWWKVDDRKGLVGWSAEGLGTDKYLLPVGWAK